MLDRLTTEERNPSSSSIDQLDTLAVVDLINQEDACVASAVGRQAKQIASAVDAITAALRSSGRLIYLGAGTSGRLGVLDASECPPTFNTDPRQVLGVIAGGPGALVRSVEGAEDHPEDGERDLRALHLDPRDVVVGIATSGRTPYVLGGLAFAGRLGCVTVGVACNEDSELEKVSNIMITPVVGPEVISGSTRLKAGTATKLVLNTLTTATMVRLGKTYGNLMVDLRATNSKLLDRTRRIVRELTGLDDLQAEALLQQCKGELKTAVVSGQLRVSPDEARKRLDQAEGHLRRALSDDLSVDHD